MLFTEYNIQCMLLVPNLLPHGQTSHVNCWFCTGFILLERQCYVLPCAETKSPQPRAHQFLLLLPVETGATPSKWKQQTRNWCHSKTESKTDRPENLRSCSSVTTRWTEWKPMDQRPCSVCSDTMKFWKVGNMQNCLSSYITDTFIYNWIIYTRGPWSFT